MSPTRTEAEIAADIERVTLEIAKIGNYLEGSLQKSVKRHTRKDGTVVIYPLPPVLQYPLAQGGQSRMRIPAQHVQLVRELLEAGEKRRQLLAQHRALALEWTKLQLRSDNTEKKTPRSRYHSSR